MIEQKDQKNLDLKSFWCHNCQQQFLSYLRPGIDQVVCPRCSNDFCQLFTSKSKPNSFEPFQKSRKPRMRRLPRITAQAVLVALSQYSQQTATEKVRQINQQDIRRLKISIDKPIDQCLICKQQFRIGGQALKCPCGHIYHIECLSEWMQYKNSCPKCRQKILTHLQQRPDKNI